jgi:hypothetical protein
MGEEVAAGYCVISALQYAYILDVEPDISSCANIDVLFGHLA